MGLALDEPKEDEMIYEFGGLNFVMEDQVKDFAFPGQGVEIGFDKRWGGLWVRYAGARAC